MVLLTCKLRVGLAGGAGRHALRACALTIEDALRAVPGVQRADVSAATRRARVVWHPGRLRPSQWMQAVQRAGYKALPPWTPLRATSASARAAAPCALAGRRLLHDAGDDVRVAAYVAQRATSRPRWSSAALGFMGHHVPMVVSRAAVFLPAPARCAPAPREHGPARGAGHGHHLRCQQAGTFDPSGLFGREVFYDSLTMFVFFLLTGRWWSCACATAPLVRWRL